MRQCTMNHRTPLDEAICTLLSEYRRIAVTGLSEKPWRDSHRVAAYLIERGYDVIPVNPLLAEVLGRRSYPDLLSIPQPVEVVDIFRRVEFIPEIVEQAIRVGAKAIWTQKGLVDEVSGDRARRAGLFAVMNRCIMVEHGLHFG